MTTVALGADHAGFSLKQAVKAWLDAQGLATLDLGTDSAETVDYPDYAGAVARAVAEGRAARGILICGTGVGMAIAANKVAGIRAAVAADPAMARLCREHNDANVLALGARVTSPSAAMDIVAAWLVTEFQGGRHARRLAKLAALEQDRREPSHVAAG